MTSSRRSSLLAASRRPAGPRCHGGASSLLRLGFGALPPRVAARTNPRREPDGSADASVEHVVGLPLRSQQRATVLSS
jgi:hypothetical protein